MTVFYYDLSSYDAGFSVPAGSVAVVAKATEGVYYKDDAYKSFRTQAARVGAAFSGYHFLKAESSPEAQASYYHAFAGNTPCMLDVETSGTSKPGVDWCLRFIKALEGLGGRVWGVYYPRWYWSITGGDLGLLEAYGAVIVSSLYKTYNDSGDGWVPYGGASKITVWQYKDSPHDTNAFKGSPAELAALINGDNMPLTSWDIGAIWDFKNPTLDPYDMRQRLANAESNSAQALTNTSVILKAIVDLTAKVSAISGGSVDPSAVADAELAEIKAKL